MMFALFFLGEYANMILMSVLIVILFCGGWNIPVGLDWIWCADKLPWLQIKVMIFVFMFVLIRGVLPRYRYDQLMVLGWKNILPMSIGWLMLVIGLFTWFDMAV
jgi:NADH-quinone oxidoreductase subunit H